MNQTYTNKEAMAKLDLISRSAFYHMKRKYPHAFIIVQQSAESGVATRYDRPALDKFVEVVKTLKQKGRP
jgi:hypothetical protein